VNVSAVVSMRTHGAPSPSGPDGELSRFGVASTVAVGTAGEIRKVSGERGLSPTHGHPSPSSGGASGGVIASTRRGDRVVAGVAAAPLLPVHPSSGAPGTGSLLALTGPGASGNSTGGGHGAISSGVFAPLTPSELATPLVYAFALYNRYLAPGAPFSITASAALLRLVDRRLADAVRTTAERRGHAVPEGDAVRWFLAKHAATFAAGRRPAGRFNSAMSRSNDGQGSFLGLRGAPSGAHVVPIAPPPPINSPPTAGSGGGHSSSDLGLAVEVDAVSPDTFEELQREVHAVLFRDAFPRFMASPAWALWSAKRPTAARTVSRRGLAAGAGAADHAAASSGATASAGGAGGVGVPVATAGVAAGVGLLRSLSRGRLVIGGGAGAGGGAAAV
jgi:hypothetical protein